MLRFSPAVPVLGLALLAGCNGDDSVNSGAGSLHVVVNPAQTPFDQDGFAVRIDEGSLRPIPDEGELVIQGLNPGAHTVLLTDVDLPCQVSGENPRTVTLSGGDEVTATFNIVCSTTGFINVTTHTTGDDPDPDGYALTVDGQNAPLIDANATVTLAVDAGNHAVTLSDVADNCAVQGDDTQMVAVTAGASTGVTFEVVCTAAP
jgi:hypothetical protein